MASSEAWGESKLALRRIWNQASHWTLLFCLLAAALYCVLRINRIESHRFFGAHLGSDLTIQGSNRPQILESTGFLRRGEKIVAVNGTPVSDLADFQDRLKGEHHVPVRFDVAGADGVVRELLFWDAPVIPDLRKGIDAGFSWDAELPEELASLLREGRLSEVEGAKAEAGALSGAYSSHPWWLQFTIEDENTGRPLSVLFWRSDYRLPWTLLLVGICFGGLGLTVYQMRADTRSSRAFLWFSLCAAIFFLLRSIPGHFRMPWESQAFGLTLCALFVASVHFSGTFTSLRVFYMRSPLYFRFAITAAVVLLFAWFTLQITMFLIMWSAALLFLLGCVLLGPRFIDSRGIKLSGPDIQRNQIAAVALSLSLGPPLIYLFLELAAEKEILTFISESKLPSRFWFELPAVCFPLVIGYAVIRRNLLQVNELLVEGATYGLLALGMGGAFATFVGLAVPAVERIRPGSSVLMTAAGAGLVAWCAYPIFNRSRRRLEERFHQSLRGYDSLANRLLELGEDSDDRVGFCQSLAPSLRDLTRAASVTIVLPHRFASAPIFCGSLPDTVRPEEMKRCWQRIMAAEIEAPREIQREELIDSSPSEESTWELLDALDALRLLFVFPLISEGIVHGLVGVSGKVDNRNYSRAELQKLRLVARECALALYGFTIRENMRAKRRAEENLRKSEEKLRDSQKLEAVATLAGGIAHDFHNLITAIFAFTAVAKDTLPFDHPAAGAISNVEEAARQASGITKSLLVFTRKSRSERLPIDLSQFVPRAVRFVQSALPSNVRLQCEVESHATLWIEADESQIHQVIMNLVLNARDAMPDGGDIRIRVSRNTPNESELAGTGDRVSIEIEDTGVGMSDEVRRRAFEPFFTTKNRDKGTGLGLSIVRGIIQDNGGSIDLESSIGKGTRVELSFPSCKEEIRAPVRVERSAKMRSSGYRILVVDDNRMIRLGLSTCLIQEGYDVVQASDGEVFSEIMKESHESIDLVVLDLDMPGMDGIDCLEFRSRENISVPVILITGEPLNHFDHLSYPDVTLLKKPFGIPGFMSAVNERLPNQPSDKIRQERLTV